MAEEQISEVEFESLLCELTEEELEALLEGEEDTEDVSCLPASGQCTYVCLKKPTGPLDSDRLREFIEEQEENIPYMVDYIPYEPGKKRGKVWQGSSKPAEDNKDYELNEFNEIVLVFNNDSRLHAKLMVNVLGKVKTLDCI